MATTMLSLDALNGSFRTILNQHDPDATRLTSLGFNTAAGFRALVRSDGEYNLFVDKDRVKVTEIIQWSAEPRMEFKPLARAISLALQHGAAVTVVIIPVSADEMEVYRQAGVMKLYDDWRKQVTDIVAAASHSGSVTLWDFSAPSPYTTESLPPRGDRTTQLHWFWESNHFRSALGDVLIRRIFDNEPADFGTVVTPDTLPEIQAYERALRQQYEEARPQDVKRVADLYKTGLRVACQSNAYFCDQMHLLLPGDDRDMAVAEHNSETKVAMTTSGSPGRSDTMRRRSLSIERPNGNRSWAVAPPPRVRRQLSIPSCLRPRLIRHWSDDSDHRVPRQHLPL